MAGPIVLFSEEDTLFRLMETALNRRLSARAEKALHYFFGEDISRPVAFLEGLPGVLGLPDGIKGIVCEEEDRLEMFLKDADILVAERVSISRNLLEKGRGRLKLVQKFGSDYRNIDHLAAREMGIPVSNLLRVSTISVAEHVILLILALARNIVKAHGAALARREVQDGALSDGPPRTLFNWGKVSNIVRVSGKTLGLVGFGENGREVAKRAYALGMNILYFQRNRAGGDIEAECHAEYVPTLFELMDKADFVTLHVPYGPPTDKLVTYEALSRMKPEAYFINSSRGGLVDEGALFRILSEGKIRGAALDVYRWEPLPSDSPLLGLDNIIWSTHNAGGAPEFMLEESQAVLENIGRVLRGEKPQSWVNRF